MTALFLFVSITLVVVALVLTVSNWFIKSKKVNLVISIEIILLAAICGVLCHYIGNTVIVVISGEIMLVQVLFTGNRILNVKKEG